MNNEKMNFENGITPNPFDRLSTTELQFLLEHDKEKLTDAQIVEVQARIDRANEIDAPVQNIEMGHQLVKEKSSRRRAGYVDIIVLMLTTWAACIGVMAYIYTSLNIMG